MSTTQRPENRTRLFDSDVLRRFPFEALELPPSGQEWLSKDTDISHPALVAFHKAGVIEKKHLDDDQPTRAYWETTEGVHQYAQERFSDLDTTPCGNATGVRNLGDDEFTCTDETCECRMDRRTAREVVA